MAEGDALVPATVDTPAGSGKPVRPVVCLGWGLSTALAFAVSAALIAADHLLITPPAPRYARVDLARILAEAQRGFADRVARGEARQAYDEAAQTGQGLAKAVQRLARECGCVVLVADAVVAGAEDLTPRLRDLVHAKD